MKGTYTKYKFSVSRHNHNPIHIYLVKADFEAFKKDKGGAYFCFHNCQRLQGRMVFGEDSTGIVETNTFDCYPIQMPRLLRSEWISWRKQVFATSSSNIIAVPSNLGATLPKPKLCLKRSVRRLSSHIRCGRQSSLLQYDNYMIFGKDMFGCYS